MCQKWFSKFHAANFSLNAAPWSDKPVKVDSKKIKTLLKNN